MDPLEAQIGDVTIQKAAPTDVSTGEPETGPDPQETPSEYSEFKDPSAKSVEPAEIAQPTEPPEISSAIKCEDEKQTFSEAGQDGDAPEDNIVKNELSEEDHKNVKVLQSFDEKSEGRESGERSVKEETGTSHFLESASGEEGLSNVDEGEFKPEDVPFKLKEDQDKSEGDQLKNDSESEEGKEEQSADLEESNVKSEPHEKMEDDDDENDYGSSNDRGYVAADDILDNPNGQDYENSEGEEMALGDEGDMAAQDEEDMEDQHFDLEDTSQLVKAELQDEDLEVKEDGCEDGGKEGDTEMKKKLRTRKKRKIVVEEDTDESEEGSKKKRKKRKKKGSKGDNSETSEETESEDDGSGKKKKKKKKKIRKKKKKDDDDDGSGDNAEKKKSNMRRNIRDVMDETQLDEATLAAQRQEMERLQRVQEQQRILREMAQQRQQQQRAEQKVLSLLQGNTSILKQVSVSPSSSSRSGPSSTSPNTVVVKVGSGENAQSNKKVLELLRVPKGAASDIKPSVTKTLLSKPRSLQGTTMMTPSVSIAPVKAGAAPLKSSSIVKQPSLIQAQASYSASEGEDEEVEEEEEEEEENVVEGEVDEEGKKKKKDVVTISSSSSSEDDCIVLSEPSDAGEDEDEEDPTNSGMHTNDSYNVPDEEGRVQVNMGKPEGDPDIFLAPHIARIIKPHQIGGIRFLYDNVIESIERFNTSTGFGCILAHSMGLGKTLQVITFCDIFLRHTPAKTVMCIMPINTLQNWLAEFNMWMPEDALATPLAVQGEVRPRTFGLFVLNDSHKTLKARAKVVEDWSKEGGVLLIGYEMYRQLSLKKMTKPKKSRRKRIASDEEDVDREEEEKRQKEILEKVFESLVKPGPDLVICDEGHRIKNSHASISMALKQIRSKRRIVLTGYPLQNNLLEYWCMVDFVRPNYLGTKTEFCNMFERPIQNGQCIDSTPQDIRLMRYRAHVLHSLLEGFVQRRSHAVLQTALPQKEEYVLLVRMTPFQRKLYETFMNEVVRTKAVPNPLKAFAVCCKIWNHPDVLYQFLKKREGGEGVDLDLEEAAAALAANTVIDPTGTPNEERRTATKSRSRSGGSKSRKKKETTPAKPAAAVLPNTSSQSDSNNTYGLSGQYPLHGQLNSSSMMGSYNPYSSTGQSSYGSFNAPSHHYTPSNSYGHSGYSGSSGFNSGSGSMGMSSSGQGSFSGSGSSGYGDSIGSSPASQTSQYGSSSSQSMFSGPSSSNASSSSTTGYGGMGPPYFSGNSSSGQHTMTDNFSSSTNYSQNWNSSSNYNNFNQGSSNSQSFSGSNYSSSSSNPSFQGYGGSSSSSYNQNIYGSGSSGSGSSSTQPYQPGLIDQQILDQNLMAPPNRPSLNPNLIPQQSPVNASGMLPGGAPTKNPSMLPPSMSSGLMGSGMGVGLSNSVAGLGGMNDNMMSHHSQAMNMYQNSGLMDLSGQSSNHSQVGSMSALSSLTSADVPPSAEDLLHSATDDFRPFDPSLGKAESGRSMYDVKDRNMFDPWGNSHGHSQDFSLINSQEMKTLQNSVVKKSENDKFNPGPSPLDQLKNEIRDVKLEDKQSHEINDKEICLDTDSGVKGQNDQDTKGNEGSDSWQVDSMEIAEKDKDTTDENKDKEGKEEEEEPALGPDGKPSAEAAAIIKTSGREDPGIPYDWAVELMKDYVPGLIENSAKMVLFFCILEESLALGDRILLFSQSLFTLSLIEEYLQRSFIPVPGVYERWQRNRTYFRLDGSTAALEREKLINEFNANPNVYLFLVSTRAGSLGINLVGANRVIVFDASWNPCHDTQAVCRVYRYGQRKPCFVYRFVMDNCLEKKIYDRQINKQGMSDRVVDECNPDAHLSIKEVTNLCWDDEKETEVKDLGSEKDNFTDLVMQKILEKHGKLLSKAPFQHESLLVDRKDKKLSQAEKRLAKRSYEMEKRAANRPVYNYYNAGQGGLQIRAVQRDAQGNIIKPIASVRPMQSEINSPLTSGNRNTKWIPAEVWQRQGMSAQEMTLPLDVVIPTNSPERSSIVLKAGQRVMVLKSPKGIYMQLENGKIIAIRTAFKMGANNKPENKAFAVEKDDLKKGIMNKGNIKLTSGIHPLRNNPNITITPRTTPAIVRSGIRPIMNRAPGARMQTTANMRPWVRPGGVAGRAVPLRPNQNIRPGFRGLSPSVTVTPATMKSRSIGPVTITPRLAPANFSGLQKSSESNKDKLKTEIRTDKKQEETEKFESDEGQSSNSSLDVPSISNKASIAGDIGTQNVEDKVSKEKVIGAQMGGDESSSYGSSRNEMKHSAVDHGKNLNELSSIEKPSSDMHSNRSSIVGSNHDAVPDSTNVSLKNYHHSNSQHNLQQQQQQQQQALDLHSMSSQENKKRDSSNVNLSGKNLGYSGGSVFSSSEKVSSQPSIGFSGNFSSSSSSLTKQYGSNVHGGNMLSPTNYSISGDRSMDDRKSSNSIDNQWKNTTAPQPFSSGLTSGKSNSHQRSLESPAYDDNSSASGHLNLSSKSSASNVSKIESRVQSSSDTSLLSYSGADSSSLHLKASNKPTSGTVPSANRQSSPSNSKLNSSSSTSTSVPTTTPSNFPALDPYANLYGTYGAYAGGLSSSNYYSPYSYPPGFLPDPKSALSSKSSSENNQSTVPSRSSSSKSSSSSSRSEAKKVAHESSRSSQPSYDSRHSSNSGSSSSATNSNRSGASSSSLSSGSATVSTSSADTGASYSSSTSAAAAAASYNPMMMSPSFNPTSCQYPPPATASGSTNPFTAAAAATYPSPYASPYAYPGSNQFETDLARASMYSAFHRPEAGLDPTSPYLAALPAHTRPAVAAPPAGSFYSQNMYGGQYGSARDPYAQLPPYAASPFIMPPAPYSGLASSASSTSTSDQAPSQ